MRTSDSVVAERDLVGVPQAVVVELVTVDRVVETRLELGLVLGVVVRCLELGRGGLLHVVDVHPRRELRAQLLRAGVRRGNTGGVGVALGGVDLVAVTRSERVGARAADRQVPLGVLTLDGAGDDARLVAVEQLLVVVALQGDAPASGDRERDDRSDEDRHPHEVGDLVDAGVQLDRDDVVAAGRPGEPVERHQGHHDRGARGRVARALEQVVVALVAGDPALEEGEEHQDDEHQRRHQQDRDQHVPRDRVAEDHRLHARGHDAQQSVGPPHVPVGLRARRHLGRVVGTELPDRVDRQQPAHEGDDAEDHEEEATGLGGVHGQHRVADDVLLGASGPGPLGVLVVDEQQHVGRDQCEQDARDQQHVDDVEPRDDRLARELAAEEQERHVRPGDRRGLEEPVRGADAGAGQEVVGERVAGEALEGAEEQQDAADDPVELAGLAVGAGEGDAQQVHHHRGDEDHRRPVVHLAHEQAAAHVERDVQGGGHGLRHADAAELVVGAFVGHVAHRRVEPQGEEDTGEEQHDEAPQRDLTEHERPVVGEDLAQVLLHRRGQAEAIVRPRGERAGWAALRCGRGVRAVARRNLAGVEP